MLARPIHYLFLFLVLACTACSESSVFVTGEDSDTFSTVWVEIESVILINEDGREPVLFESDLGEIFNITALTDIGTLLSTNNIPAGDYTTVEVSLSSDLTLVEIDGTLINGVLSTDGSSAVYSIPCSFTVEPDQPTALVVSFDLSQFEFSPDSDLVIPAITCTDASSARVISSGCPATSTGYTSPDSGTCAPTPMLTQ